jgi:hypothetical protein
MKNMELDRNFKEKNYFKTQKEILKELDSSNMKYSLVIICSSRL